MLVPILIKRIMYSLEIYLRRPESNGGKFHCFMHVSFVVVVAVVIVAVTLVIVSRANISILSIH